MSSATVSYPSSGLCAAASFFEQVVSIPRWNRPDQKFIVKFSTIKYERSVFELYSPVELLLYSTDGGWGCEEDKLGIFAFGETKEQAVCSFFEDFAVLWEEIGQAGDDTLSGNARRTKNLLLASVKSHTAS